MGTLKYAALGAFAAAAALSSTAAVAQSMPGRTQSGSVGELTWTAESRIVGNTSTATLVAGGNPIFLAPKPQYSGVAALIMDYGAGGLFICSGSLLPDRRSIITAAHCVSDGTSARPNITTAFFSNGLDEFVPFNASSAAVNVGEYYVAPGYTGQVIDQNDLAILRLGAEAPGFATSYELFTGTDLTGLGFNVAGYGGRSNIGGSLGVNLGTGRLRQGDNRYDFRFGDAQFGGFWDGFFGTADVEFSYVSDFDNGLAANDMSCRIAGAFGLGGSKYCNTGVGALEVSTAGGDSGGPQFINGMIASVSSYGLSFGTGFGDCVAGLQSSCGEFNGFVPVHIHGDFIRSTAIPEPTTWAMMIGGFGLVGSAMRRRARAKLAVV